MVVLVMTIITMPGYDHGTEAPIVHHAFLLCSLYSSVVFWIGSVRDPPRVNGEDDLGLDTTNHVNDDYDLSLTTTTSHDDHDADNEDDYDDDHHGYDHGKSSPHFPSCSIIGHQPL